MFVRRVVSVVKAGGVLQVGRAVLRLRMPRARSFAYVRASVKDRVGLEIGGPSPIFAAGGLLPLYPLARRIDNVNFAGTTIWEGAIVEGASFVFHRRKTPGQQYIFRWLRPLRSAFGHVRLHAFVAHARAHR